MQYILTNWEVTFVRIAVNGEWQAPTPVHSVTIFRFSLRSRFSNTNYSSNKTEPYTEPSTPGQSDPSQNIRQYHFPTYLSDNPNSVRCGRDNMAHAGMTEKLKVKAGDLTEVAHQKIEPKLWADNQCYGCTDNRGTCNPDYIQV